MNTSNILAGWVIFQLLVIGLVGGFVMNDKINCIPDKAGTAYDDSIGYNLISIALPLVYFAPEQSLEVKGCPEAATATSTPAK